MGLELGPAIYLVKGLHNGAAQVTTSVGATDTIIPYANDTGEFPDAGLIKLEDEYILYRAIDRDAKQLLRCVRGFYGTTAATHDGATAAIDFSVLYSSLGRTHGGATVSASEETVDLTSDQDGSTPVDRVVTGATMTITLNLADITLDAFAFAHKTTVQGTPGQRYVLLGGNVGQSILDNAKSILIVPLIGYQPTTDPENTYFIPKGGIMAKEELSFSADTQRVLAVEITAFPDDTVGAPMVRGYAGSWL